MRDTQLPSPATLRQQLRYEPKTGRLFWRERSPDSFADGKYPKERSCSAWNSRFAGKEAFKRANKYGYRNGQVNNIQMKAHRVVWAICKGEWPQAHIDHINGDTGDNRIENLRDVSASVNMRNAKMSKNNTSGHTGVTWNKKNSKWYAQGRAKGRYLHLGSFDSIEDAVQAREDFNRQNGYTERHGDVEFDIDG